jgi:hypothetical protein
LAFESSSFIERRNSVRHSVTETVYAMYATSATPVIAANHTS